LDLARDRRRHVAVPRPGRKRSRLVPPEVAPALRDRALHRTIVESESDAVKVVDRVELVVEAVFGLPEGIRRRAWAVVRIARESEDRTDDLAGEELERGVVDVAGPGVGLLARTDSLGVEPVGTCWQ